jgi:signal transduction histidine kinase
MTALRRWLVLGVAVMSGMVWHTSAAEDLPAGTLHLTRATRLEAGLQRPAAPPAALQGDIESAAKQVTLPDNWDSSRQDRETLAQSASYVWYLLDFATPTGWHDKSLGVYLPAVGMNAELFVNGQRIGSFGRMEEPITRHFYTPLLYQLPSSLLQPAGLSNQMQLLVVGYPQHRNGLGEVWVGEMPSLRSAWLWRGFWQNTGTLISSALTIVMAIYLLTLWMRQRSDAAFGWFGLAAGVWGVRNLNLVITELPIPNLIWTKLSVYGAVGFVGFFAFFALHYAHSHAPASVRHDKSSLRWPQRIVWAFMVVACYTLLSAETFEITRARFKYVAFFGIALTCFTQAKLSLLAWRLRSTDSILIALAGLIYIALMMNDYSVTNDKFSLGQYYLRQYAALPLFIAVGAMLTRRYLAALEAQQTLSDSLQSQVQQQHDLLARNFERMRGVERQSAQTQERERLMRDLHDGLGLHLLSALVQAKSPDADPVLLANTLQDCLDDLRVAVDSLDGDERDPAAVLGTLRFRMAPRLEAAGLHLAWELDDDVPELTWLDPPKVLQLLRIVQEALTNAMRHSGAGKVTIALRTRTSVQGQAVLEVSVSDDGRGFTPKPGGGHGLRNMHIRAISLGGSLTIESLAQGTRVCLSLPVQAGTSPEQAPALQ